MSETWVDAEDYDDIGEGAYDSDDIGEDFGEESRSARRQRERQARLARQRQIVLARQRQAQMRRIRQPQLPARTPVGAPRTSRPTIRAIRSLDLETKVELDSLRRAVEESNRRANQANWAAVAGTAVNQGLDSFAPNLTNQYLRAGARFAPLLFLSPAKKRGGAQGFATDPRFIGGASILAIALLHNFTSRVHSVLITPPTAPVPVTSPPQTGTLVAIAKDRLGIEVKNVTFTWRSDDTNILDFAPSSVGDFTAIAAGRVDVFAKAPNGVEGTLRLQVGP